MVDLSRESVDGGLGGEQGALAYLRYIYDLNMTSPVWNSLAIYSLRDLHLSVSSSHAVNNKTTQTISFSSHVSSCKRLPIMSHSK